MASEQPPPSLNDFHPLDAYVNKKSVALHHRALMLGFLGEVVTFLAYMLSGILVAPMRPFPDIASVAWWVFFAAHIQWLYVGLS